MADMLEGCSSLISLDLSSFNSIKTSDAFYMLKRYQSLTDLKFGNNLKVNIGFK